MRKDWNLKCTTLLALLWTTFHSSAQPRWITSASGNPDKTNTWIAFRKDFTLNKTPSEAITRIAVDSKYWLWINGELVVFEGGLKRGPSPADTYFDEINLARYLKKGDNKIAILLWYFGKNGFSHKDSGKAGLIFDMKAGNLRLSSDSTWTSRIHPAYATAYTPAPNFRLAESNIRFIAEMDMPGWQTADCSSTYSFSHSKEIGQWGDGPWNSLIRRPIPLWKDYGITKVLFDKEENDKEIVYTASLPYNMQMTPIIEVSDSSGSNIVQIETDHSHSGGADNLRAEYITSKGHYRYESLGWMNGQKLIVRHDKDANVEINSIAYRETGYDCYPEGDFSCDNEFIMRFWRKALRTLYVNMRDTYFDCPDRERAQWWGDVVVLMGESFYTYSTSTHALMKKAIRELADWQKEDGTLFSPIPAGNYSDELPAQMLAAIGEYGFWNYYMNTGDIETIKYVYPAVKKYLDIWQLDSTGLTEFRAGGWSWGDWGENIDIRLILAAWHSLALKSAAQMADILGEKADAVKYRLTMKSIKDAYNACWNGYAYRHPEYQKETDDRAQALAILAGIAEVKKYDKIFRLLKTQWHSSPYMEKYVMEALFKIGQGAYALKRMEKRFSPMINDKAHTTLFEDWCEGGAGGGSTNHAWSGGALTVIAKHLCGVSPLEPAFKTFTIAPDPTLFKTASISIPTVSGIIRSHFEDSDSLFTLRVEVPQHTNAIIVLPPSVTKISKVIVDGNRPKRLHKNIAAGYQQNGKICLKLESGLHEIKSIKVK